MFLKRLTGTLLLPLLLPVAAAQATSATVTPIPGEEIALPFPFAPSGKACGYSAGGIDTAWDDAAGNAHRACVAAGCTGADIYVSYMPWVDGQGYTRVCVGYRCTGCGGGVAVS